jgi:alanine racemase
MSAKKSSQLFKPLSASLGAKEVDFPHPSWIEIDLSQFKKNIGIIRQKLSKELFCLPVKANAYGHGLCQMGKAAEEAGVDYLAVAHLQEGIELREKGASIPILVLGAIHENQIASFINFNLEFTISSPFKAKLVEAVALKMRRRCRVHLEVETGMQRTGMRCETLLSLFKEIKNSAALEVVGIYSHLAKADIPDDPFTKHQIELFQRLKQNAIFEGFPIIWHIANSGALLHYKEAYFDMVRPSFCTFGYEKLGAPCFSLKSRISYFKVVEEAHGISYGHTFTTSKKTRIVTIPIGYGDGYRRALSNKASVLIRGKRYPVVGTICMDQMMVDIGSSEAFVGDEVTLIGKQGEEEISAQEIASLCDTTVYEVLCFFNNRLPRIFLPSQSS